MDPGIRNLVVSRLEGDGSSSREWSGLVLASLSGRAALEAELSGSAAAPRAVVRASPALSGAFLRSITVEGFRGIGPRQTLELQAGPGLTLVVGRNGSGKSSFAEGLEVLLTGDSLRWRERAAVWREGWRNLHHQPASLSATFLIEGEPGPCVASRRWEDEGAFEASRAAVDLHDKPGSDLSSLGWSAALRTHRPFLSYNELGSLLDEGPSKLYDALSSILGLEDLVDALGALQEARRTREKSLKESSAARDGLLLRLRAVEDERARRVAAALDSEEWDLDAVEQVLGGIALTGAAADEAAVLRGSRASSRPTLPGWRRPPRRCARRQRPCGRRACPPPASRATPRH